VIAAVEADDRETRAAIAARDTILATVYGMTVVIGYLTSAFLGWLGLLRRDLLALLGCWC